MTDAQTNMALDDYITACKEIDRLNGLLSPAINLLDRMAETITEATGPKATTGSTGKLIAQAQMAAALVKLARGK